MDKETILKIRDLASDPLGIIFFEECIHGNATGRQQIQIKYGNHKEAIIAIEPAADYTFPGE